MGWYNNGLGWGGWIAMALMMVAFWGLVIVAVVAIFRRTSKATRPADPAVPRDAMSTLDERFARGEIDADEYHARKSALRNA
jgi:putative membrane protein